jgi:hypothetical protein
MSMDFLLKIGIFDVPPKDLISNQLWYISADDSTKAWKMAEDFASHYILDTPCEFNHEYVGWLFTDPGLPTPNGQQLIRIIEFRPVQMDEFIQLSNALKRFHVNEHLDYPVVEEKLAEEIKPSEEVPKDENLDK